MTKLITVLTLMSLLAACGSSYKAESISSRMERLKSRELHANKSPQWTVMEMSYAKDNKNSKRGPASIKSLDTKQENKRFNKASNKRLYFYALYTQFKKLNAFFNNDFKEINSCPSFHSELVSENLYKQKYSPKSINSASISYIKNNQAITEQAWAAFPELSLPLMPYETQPRLGDMLKTKGHDSYANLLNTALKIHMRKTYNEIMEMCEYGNTHNYYIFNNLITYFDEHQSFKENKKAVQAILKIPVFNNLALLDSISGTHSTAHQRMPASASPDLLLNEVQEELFQRMKIDWSKQYFEALKDARQSL